tara:strand:- start:2830 stop:3048 length:219 start_codon:yes stop_codon:yes gene_type:complete
MVARRGRKPKQVRVVDGVTYRKVSVGATMSQDQAKKSAKSKRKRTGVSHRIFPYGRKAGTGESFYAVFRRVG